MVKIKFRRDISSEWEKFNPILSDGEPGYESDTKKVKIGDGETRWLELDYYLPTSGDVELSIIPELNDHINSDAPHPVYDDGPSLTLLYQNAKV